MLLIDHPFFQSSSVSKTGTVAVVHNPDIHTYYETDINVNADNINHFRVDWIDDYPKQLGGNCGHSECIAHGSECLCNINISEIAVFLTLPSLSEVLDKLRVGGFDASISDEYTFLDSNSDVEVFEKNGGGYDKESLFKIDYLGETIFLKNSKSIVDIGNGRFQFRNPVQFLNPALREARDAHYETDAVLKHYVQHPNTAPFLAQRMIKRFGTSNPSPSYVKDVAVAFKTGTYTSAGKTFGDGKYGSMESMVAAIILHNDARNVLLDADPTSGSLREPLLKFISYLRSMEFSTNADAPELRLYRLQEKIGQDAHSIPNVFSFFLPEYQASGEFCWKY